MKNWFIFNGLSATIFGLLLLLVPTTFLTFTGTAWTGSLVQPVGRMLGAQTLGYAFLSFWSARIDHVPSLRMILTGFFFVDLIGAGISAWALADGAFNRWGSLVLGSYALAAAGWMFFLRRLR